MKKIAFTMFILIFVTVAIAGCSGTSATPATQPEEPQSTIVHEDSAQNENTIAQEENAGDTVSITIEPEQLLSQDEVSALLGEPVKEAEKSQMESVGQKIALYNPIESGSFVFLQISLSQISAMPSGSFITPEEVYGSSKAALNDTSDFSVSGIGDDCFSGTPGLHILYKGYYIVIGAGNTNDETVQTVLLEAGKLAVANLSALLQ